MLGLRTDARFLAIKNKINYVYGFPHAACF